MTEIRKAARSDLKQVQACALAAYQIYVKRIGREPAPMVADFAASIKAGQHYVFEEDGDIAGFVVCYAKADHFHLENIAVSPDFQKRGIGKKLIEFAEQLARAGGYPRVELYTNAKMVENLELYPMLGYQQFDRRLEDGFDRVYFKKNL